MTQILAPSTREEWLGFRRSVVGASEIAVLFGAPTEDEDYSDGDASPWTSLFKLSAIKTGIVEDDKENESMRGGRLLEPVAVQCIKEERPDWAVQHNTLPDLQYFIDSKNRIGATPDVFVKIPGREGRGVIQIKWVSVFAFRRRWLRDGMITPPLYTAIQASIECATSNSQYAMVAALVIGRGVNLHLHEIEIEPGFYAAAAARSLAFWAKVDRGEMYEPNFEKDADLIREIYSQGVPGKEVDLSHDNEIMELIENDRMLGNVEGDTKDARKLLRAKVRFKMKDAEIAKFHGETIATLKTVHRKASAASSSRQLRFKGSKE